MIWLSAYSVGIAEIDVQHKELVRLFSNVEESIVTDQGWSAIHYGIVELTGCAQFHFRFEEALMRLYGFPGCGPHSEEHGKIMHKLAATSHESLRADAKEEMLMFFKEWLINHILGTDRFYAQYILSGARVVVPDETSLCPD